MSVFYLSNESVRARLNGMGLDYTPAFIPALLAYMGVTAKPVSSEELEKLTSADILLAGAERLEALPACTVILMGTAIGEDTPPATRHKRIFARYITSDGYRLPLFVPMGQPRTDGEALAKAVREDGCEQPALVRRGKVFEFCFDLPATVWFSGDGFMPEEPSDYFFIRRTPDARPLPDGESTAEPFNDRLIGELEAILRSLGVPSIHRLPPTEDGEAPDAILHISGDDDCTSVDFNRQAAQAVAEYGFRYHVNAMPAAGDHFVFDRAVYDELDSLGCEVALHLDFTCGVPYTEAATRAQRDLFESVFSVAPYTGNNHCLIQDGSTAERLRWLGNCGILADNGKMGEFDPNDINAFNLCGFGFGTAFPRFTCDDAAHGNTPLPTVDIPITYYEPRLWSDDAPTDKVTGYLDSAVENSRVIQYFMHPHYLAHGSPDRPAGMRVLALTRDYCTRRGYRIPCSTTDCITAFWHARARAEVQAVGDAIEVQTDIPVLIRLPDGWHGTETLLDGASVRVIRKTVAGAEACLVYVGAGMHRISRAGIAVGIKAADGMEMLRKM